MKWCVILMSKFSNRSCGPFLCLVVFDCKRLATKAIKTKLVVNICNQTFNYQKRQNTKSFKILETTCIVTNFQKQSLQYTDGSIFILSIFYYCINSSYFSLHPQIWRMHFFVFVQVCNADLFVHFSINWFHGIFLAFSTISWAIFMPIVSFFCMASLRLFEELFNSLSDNWISSSATFLFFSCFLSTFHFLSFFYFQHYLLYFFFPLAL